ncbi:MAG: hypothetical protein RML72_09805, partial [Bacteroidia bacterium]|nr:hypothetical protein [Bacteroidia bacterium]MDW8159150.1 hypothetical protein [Bacteroidia bacterium]
MKKALGFFYFWAIYWNLGVNAQLLLQPANLSTLGGLLGDTGFQLAIDRHDNQWLTGFFTGTSQFGRNALQSRNNSLDAFVAKYDVAGNCLWVKQLGGNEFDVGKAVTCLPNGNCCISGTFRGKAWIGSDTLYSQGDQDVFVILLSAEGQVLWLKSLAGPLRDDIWAIASDTDGNIVLSGTFRERLNLGTFTLRGDPSHTNDIFLIKLDKEGNFLWARTLASGGTEVGYGLCLDPRGYIYLAGSFNQTIYLGEINTTLRNRSGDDVFIARYTPAGKLCWVKSAGSRGADAMHALAFHSNGLVAGTGFFLDTIFFDTYRLISRGARDIFITAFDTATGKVLWSTAGGSLNNDVPYGITAARNGNFYLTGQIEGIPFWGKYSTPSQAQINWSDIFIAAVDPFWGKPIGITAYGGKGNERGNCISASNYTDNLWVTGYFNDSLRIGGWQKRSVGSTDGFLACFQAPRLQVYLPTDTLRVVCGDTIAIWGASVYPQLSWFWKPARGLSNPNAQRTLGCFVHSDMYILTGFDRNDSATASMYIKVDPITP